MCKRRDDHGKRPVDTSVGMHAYEGDTVRLDRRSSEPTHAVVRRRCGGFPWWALWLIWPALATFRSGMTRTLELVGALGSSLVVVQAIGGIVLIAAGVALLWREYRKG